MWPILTSHTDHQTRCSTAKKTRQRFQVRPVVIQLGDHGQCFKHSSKTLNTSHPLSTGASTSLAGEVHNISRFPTWPSWRTLSCQMQFQAQELTTLLISGRKPDANVVILHLGFMVAHVVMFLINCTSYFFWESRPVLLFCLLAFGLVLCTY